MLDNPLVWLELVSDVLQRTGIASEGMARRGKLPANRFICNVRGK
jgi:hypothetical protein